MTFNLQSEIAKATAEQLERLNVWDSTALEIPVFLLAEWCDVGLGVPNLKRMRHDHD